MKINFWVFFVGLIFAIIGFITIGNYVFPCKESNRCFAATAGEEQGAFSY
jgi:hypothetical protein